MPSLYRFYYYEGEMPEVKGVGRRMHARAHAHTHTNNNNKIKQNKKQSFPEKKNSSIKSFKTCELRYIIAAVYP